MDETGDNANDERGEVLRGWHFLPADHRLAHGDGRKVRVGETLSLREGQEVVLCQFALHGSENALDALRLGRKPTACRVEVWGDVQRESDKFGGRSRHCLAMLDASTVLREFACDWAEKTLWAVVLRTQRMPDLRILRVLEVTRRYVRGLATMNELRAANSAAIEATNISTDTFYSAWAAADAAFEEAAYAASCTIHDAIAAISKNASDWAEIQNASDWAEILRVLNADLEARLWALLRAQGYEERSADHDL